MDNEKLIELLVAEVLKRLQTVSNQATIEQAAQQYRVLAVFTGGSIGLETGLEELKTLQAIGIDLTVVLSQAAETVIGENWIKEKLGNEIRVITSQSPYPGKYLRAADIVLVPVLTQNTAAKLAHTLADTMVSTVIMQALMLGKHVVAAANAADPRDGWRIQKNMGQAPSALCEALENNLKKLAAYGIELIPVNKLAAAAKKLLVQEAKEAETSLPVNTEKVSKKQVLDAAFVREAAQGGRKIVRVAKETIITPLARDVARECKVDILLE